MESIINEVKQTGVAIRQGEPIRSTPAHGVAYYYSVRRNVTVYAESVRLTQLYLTLV